MDKMNGNQTSTIIFTTNNEKLNKKEGMMMAHFRETPCKYYVAYGECTKGREADYKGYCQHCSKYSPRAKVRHIIWRQTKNERILNKFIEKLLED